MMTFVSTVFHDRARAENACDALIRAGFRREDISLLMSTEAKARHFGPKSGIPVPSAEAGQVEVLRRPIGNKAGEGAAIGATAGGVLGALLLGLAAVGSIALPGLGLLAVGPLVAALAGAGAGGATGTFVGALVGSGIPQNEAELYGPHLARGGILVGVTTADERSLVRARQTLLNAGGEALSAA